MGSAIRCAVMGLVVAAAGLAPDSASAFARRCVVYVGCPTACCDVVACGGCCGLRARLAWRRACRAACCNACCWDSCDYGCGNDAGCSSCGGASTHDAGVDYEEVPTEAEPLDASAAIRRSNSFRLTSAARSTPNTGADLSAGIAAFQDGDWGRAAPLLEAAANADPSEALGLSYLAMTYYQLGDTEAANATIAGAVKAEEAQPIAQRGRRLERVQGPHRLWLERNRAAITSQR